MNDEVDVDRLRNFEASAYGNSTAKVHLSATEIERQEQKKEKEQKKAPGISDHSKNIKKNKEDSMLAHINKIAGKSGSQRDTGDYGEIDISNKLGHAKKKQQMISIEKMEKGFSKTEDHDNKVTFTE